MSGNNRKTIEKIIYGDEPVCDKEVYSQSEFITILNWYNYNASHDDLKDYTMEYVEKNVPDMVPRISDIPKTLFKGTLGSLCRILNRGYPESDYIIGKITNQLNELVEYAGEREQTKVVVEKPKPKPKDNVDTYIDDIEQYVEHCVFTGNFVNKNWDKFILEHKVKKGDGEIISDHFNKTLELLKESNEGYSLDKKQFAKYMALLQSIVGAFGAIVPVRAPRVRKQKPVDKAKLVSKVKYLREYPELKLVSISPEEIIDALIVLLYNTKTKKIQLIWGEKPLTIRGSTIFNINKETSQAKTLRKPHIIKNNFVDRDVSYILGSFRSLTTTQSMPTGAINEHTLILKTWSVDSNFKEPTTFEF